MASHPTAIAAGPSTSRRHASRVTHAALVVVVVASLAAQIGLLVAGVGDVNATDPTAAVALPVRLARLFSFFTVQSNVLVAIGAAGLVLTPDRDGPAWRVLRLDGLLGIVVTGIVYVTVLHGLVVNQGLGAWVNAGFHYVSPLLAVVGWLAFGPRPRIDRTTVAWAFAWPVAWLLFTFVRGAITGWYPYPFLDAAELGTDAAVRNAGMVVVVAALLTGLLWAVDRRLPPAP